MRPAPLAAAALSLGLLLAATFVQANAPFPDVPFTHWAYSYIQELADEGIVHGRSDGSFHPQHWVTRAETAKIVELGAGVPVQTWLANPYGDLPAWHSLRHYLLTAFDRGILRVLSGYADPDLPATRAEALRAVMVALGIPEDPQYPRAFPDTDAGAETGYANAAFRMQIVQGNNGLFLPEAFVTRAEAAKMLVRARNADRSTPWYPSTYSCQGAVPANATLCAGDDTGLTWNAPRTLVSSCTVQSKCEYVPQNQSSCTPAQGAPLPQLFPADNWWNQRMDQAPVDANSAAYISFVGTTRALHPDFGGSDGGSGVYGFPYIRVCGTQPLVPVTYVDYGDESDIGAPGRPGFPIPEQAKTLSAWIEGGAPGTVAPNGDRHMLIVDTDNQYLYELYRAHWTGTRWEAGSGAVFDLRANGRRPEGWTSADAAGLAILPGLVRYDEVFGPNEITHAFRFTTRATNGYVWPASHRAGSTAGALPMGARLRLKQNVDISGYPPEVQKIYRAMKTYGLIDADNGSDMFISGAYDTRWDMDLMNTAFRGLRASDFEVVQLGWQG